MAAVAHLWLNQGTEWLCLMHGEVQPVSPSGQGWGNAPWGTSAWGGS